MNLLEMLLVGISSNAFNMRLSLLFHIACLSAKYIGLQDSLHSPTHRPIDSPIDSEALALFYKSGDMVQKHREPSTWTPTQVRNSIDSTDMAHQSLAGRSEAWSAVLSHFAREWTEARDDTAKLATPINLAWQQLVAAFLFRTQSRTLANAHLLLEASTRLNQLRSELLPKLDKAAATAVHANQVVASLRMNAASERAVQMVYKRLGDFPTKAERAVRKELAAFVAVETERAIRASGQDWWLACQRIMRIGKIDEWAAKAALWQLHLVTQFREKRSMRRILTWPAGEPKHRSLIVPWPKLAAPIGRPPLKDGAII